MSVTDPFQNRPRWILRAIGWIVALAIIFILGYRVMFRKQVERTVSCLEQASSAERATSPAAAVEKYAACIDRQSTTAAASSAAKLPVRCRYAGVWAAARGNMVYQVTLKADGKFVGEPAENTPADAQVITGAWTVAGNALVWAYDSGAVWPPDINPISAETDNANAFTLREVNGSTTRYTLIERSTSGTCRK